MYNRWLVASERRWECRSAALKHSTRNDNEIWDSILLHRHTHCAFFHHSISQKYFILWRCGAWRSIGSIWSLRVIMKSKPGNTWKWGNVSDVPKWLGPEYSSLDWPTKTQVFKLHSWYGEQENTSSIQPTQDVCWPSYDAHLAIQCRETSEGSWAWRCQLVWLTERKEKWDCDRYTKTTPGASLSRRSGLRASGEGPLLRRFWNQLQWAQCSLKYSLEWPQLPPCSASVPGGITGVTVSDRHRLTALLLQT